MISFTMSGMFVRGFGEIAETLVSMKRLTVSVPISLGPMFLIEDVPLMTHEPA